MLGRKHGIRLLRLAFCLPTLGLLGCASHRSGAAVDLGPGAQLGIFEAAVRGVMKDTLFADWIVRVDPRPITVYHGPTFPDSTHYESVDASVISARAAVVRDLGTTTGSALPKRPNCTPVLILPHDRVISGCPKQNEAVLVLAAEAQAVEDEWILPMIGIFYDPRSSSAGTFDAIVIRNGSGWVFDRLIRRVIGE